MGVQGWERTFRGRGNTYTKGVVGREQGPFRGCRYSVFLEQMHVNGYEAEKKVGLGSWKARAMSLQLGGCVETNEEVIVLVQEKRKRSVKEGRQEAVEEQL